MANKKDIAKKMNTDKWNDLSHSGRMKSGLKFSYATQSFEKRGKGQDFAGTSRKGGAKEYYRQKGKGSLNRASGKNEGDSTSLGKGEQPRA